MIALCNYPDTVISGGHRVVKDDGSHIGITGLNVNFSFPITPDESGFFSEGWRAGFHNTTPLDLNVELFAVCADLTP
jgi:hypothetical protein